MAYGNIVENWLFKLKNRQGGFLYLSFTDETYSSNFYHGVILNKPSIRETIDLSNSSAKTSNISITIPDFTYQGNPVAIELFGGSKDYINQEVTVHSMINKGTPTQIGTFRLINVSSDGIKITLSLTSHRPWDFITIPQAKTSKNNYFPVVYGLYEPNASTRASQAFCSSIKMYPCPVETTSSGYLQVLQPQVLDGSSGKEARQHLYEKDIDAFIPLTNSSNAYSDTATALGDGHASYVDKNLYRGFITKGYKEQNSSDNDFTSPELAIDKQNTADTSTSSYKSFTLNKSGSDNSTYDLVLDCPQISGIITESQIAISYIRAITLTSGSANGVISVQDLGGTDMITDYNFSGGTNSSSGTSNDVTLTLSNGQLPTNYGVKFVNGIVSGTYEITLRLDVRDARLKIKSNLDFANNKQASVNFLSSIKNLYCGADGLTRSWSSGSCDEIQEAHLDLLIRFAGLTQSDGSDIGDPSDDDEVDGWGALDTARDGWDIRYWTLKEVKLIDVLNRMAFEGGFIFRFKADGKPQYIHIANSPSTNHTLSKDDISGIKINISPFSELITKRNIVYEKHPAENRYISSVTAVVTSGTTPRTKWNIQAKENIEEVQLEMLVNKVADIDGDGDIADENTNDSFAAYYNNIYGDLKLIVNCTVVNPAFFGIEVGNIIEFNEDNMFPTSPMGHNSSTWNNLKMIVTSTNRTLGKLSITTREI